MSKRIRFTRGHAALLLAVAWLPCWVQAADLHIGLNYPKTGPYAVQGKAQMRAARMAIKEINDDGGILGRKVKLFIRNTESNADIAARNVKDLIDIHDCEMILGGSSSAVAISGGKAARTRGKIYFGTLTYSNATTGKEGHRYMFRECHNAWMGASALSAYLLTNFRGKKYFYIAANYTWGWSTEESIREMTGTDDRAVHKGTLTPFPNATLTDLNKALVLARAMKPEVLVLVLFGKDMSQALKQASAMGLKEKMAIIAPNLTLGMAESAGPEAMEQVVGTVPWCWSIPYVYGHERGKVFVEKFTSLYGTRPSSSAASAYTILYEYKAAVERVQSIDAPKVIEALEGHRFRLLKDEQQWRTFDHQCIQTVFAVQGKPRDEVLKDPLQQDYFRIIDSMAGTNAANSHAEWLRIRKDAGKPSTLEW